MRQVWQKSILWGIGFLLLGTSVVARDWVRIESEDFILMSDARESEAERFARDHAIFLGTLRTLLGQSVIRSGKTVIIMHDRRKDLEVYTRDPRHVPSGSAINASANVDGRGVVVLGLWEDSVFGSGFLKEFESKLFVRQQGLVLPSWLNLGIGRVFSTARFNRGKSTVEFGSKPESLPRLSAFRFMDWEQFLFVGLESQGFRWELNGKQYFDQSWAMAHWILLQDKNGPERLKRLAERMNYRYESKALEDVLNAPMEEWDARLHKHLRSRKSRRRIQYDQQAIESEFKISLLRAFELQIFQSEIAAALGDEEAAEKLLISAREQAPDETLVLEAEARSHLRRDDKQAAVLAYRRAIGQGTKNPYAYLVSAGGRMERNQGRVSPELDLALSEVEAALELDPSLGQPYITFGKIANLMPEPSPEHLAVLSRRVGADAGGNEVRYYRGLLRERLGLVDDAVADMTELVNHPGAKDDTRRLARRSLYRWSFESLSREVDVLMEAKHFAQAYDAISRWREDQADFDSNSDEGRLQQQLDKAYFDSERKALQEMLQHREYERAWKRVKVLQTQATSESLQHSFGRIERQIGAVVLSARVREAREAKDWAKVITYADQFLSTQPNDNQLRGEMEEAKSEAQLALSRLQ